MGNQPTWKLTLPIRKFSRSLATTVHWWLDWNHDNWSLSSSVDSEEQSLRREKTFRKEWSRLRNVFLRCETWNLKRWQRWKPQLEGISVARPPHMTWNDITEPSGVVEVLSRRSLAESFFNHFYTLISLSYLFGPGHHVHKFRRVSLRTLRQTASWSYK